LAFPLQLSFVAITTRSLPREGQMRPKKVSFVTLLKPFFTLAAANSAWRAKTSRFFHPQPAKKGRRNVKPPLARAPSPSPSPSPSGTVSCMRYHPWSARDPGEHAARRQASDPTGGRAHDERGAALRQNPAPPPGPPRPPPTAAAARTQSLFHSRGNLNGEKFSVGNGL